MVKVKITAHPNDGSTALMFSDNLNKNELIKLNEYANKLIDEREKLEELEKAVLNQYDNGRYTSTGADGGALRYIQTNIYGQTVNASITVDHEIAQIRRIWELKLDGVEQYDMTDEYYRVRKSA